jgi:hypothetical protein
MRSLPKIQPINGHDDDVKAELALHLVDSICARSAALRRKQPAARGLVGGVWPDAMQ